MDRLGSRDPILIIMHVHISDFNSIPLFSHQGFTHIVSIGAHDQVLPHFGRFQGHFTLYRYAFDDVSHLCPEGPTRSIMEQLLEDLSHIPDEANVLIHCTAGHSRSPAAAFLLMVLNGQAYEQAYAAITQIRGPQIKPNILMIQLADQIMNCDGLMVGFAARASGQESWLTEAARTLPEITQ